MMRSLMRVSTTFAVTTTTVSTSDRKTWYATYLFCRSSHRSEVSKTYSKRDGQHPDAKVYILSPGSLFTEFFPSFRKPAVSTFYDVVKGRDASIDSVFEITGNIFLLSLLSSVQMLF